MRRWFQGIRLGVGAMVVIGLLAAMSPAASAAAPSPADQALSAPGWGHRIVPQNVYFN